MTSTPPNIPALARRLLHQAADRIDADGRSGTANTYQAKLLLEVALLQRDADCERRARCHLQRPFNPFAWCLSSLDLSQRKPVMPKQATLEDAERASPVKSTDDILAGIRRSCHNEPHLMLTIDGKVDEAFALQGSSSDLRQSEIAATVALLGNLPRACELTEAIGNSSYREGPWIAIAIEAFRRGDSPMLDRALDALGSDESRSPWTSLHLALGLMGREPWVGYPYPDF